MPRNCPKQSMSSVYHSVLFEIQSVEPAHHSMLLRTPIPRAFLSISSKYYYFTLRFSPSNRANKTQQTHPLRTVQSRYLRGMSFLTPSSSSLARPTPLKRTHNTVLTSSLLYRFSARSSTNTTLSPNPSPQCGPSGTFAKPRPPSTSPTCRCAGR